MVQPDGNIILATIWLYGWYNEISKKYLRGYFLLFRMTGPFWLPYCVTFTLNLTDYVCKCQNEMSEVEKVAKCTFLWYLNVIFGSSLFSKFDISRLVLVWSWPSPPNGFLSVFNNHRVLFMPISKALLAVLAEYLSKRDL